MDSVDESSSLTQEGDKNRVRKARAISGFSNRSGMQGPARAVSADQSDVDVNSSNSGSFVNGRHLQAIHSCNSCFKIFSKLDTQRVPLVLVSCGHTLCSKCVFVKLQTLSGTVECPLCEKVTKILNSDEHDLSNFDVEHLIKLVPRN